LLDLLRASVPNPTPPMVYRALDFLLAQGLVHKLESLHAYVSCIHPEHAHAGQFLICSDCGDARELADSRVDDCLRAVSRAQGFVSKHAVVEVFGTCASCSNKGKS